ncbi:hypothetical protein [Corynebacterium sp. UBA2622]|uniref:hypothetical protein n=1 Tax=Corynebacterium sp. UBA2622 TaxID=1946393 RepID=UPI0025C666D5|nr:hypothetical protein [Corynebacterium sp. UBA2622]
MSKRAMVATITVLALALLAAVLAIGILIGRRPAPEHAAPPAATSTASPSLSTTAEDTTESSSGRPEPVDSAALISAAAIDSIHPAPLPDPLDEFGPYTLRDSWERSMSVPVGTEWQPLEGPAGTGFPASQNKCGIAMNLTTLRSDEGLEVALIDALGNPQTTSPVSGGAWTWSTNCSTPSVRVKSGSPVMVTYSVHTYLNGGYGAGAAAAPAVPTAASPTVVKCLGTLGPAEALYSDGVQRLAPECEGSPEKLRAIRAEGMCGGLYPPEGTDPDEYMEMCHHPMPAPRP